MKKKQWDLHSSRDKRLQDSAAVQINGKVIIRQVVYWIKVDPVSLWLATRLQKLSLSNDAARLLNEAVKKIRPELIAHSDLRKTVFHAKENVTEKHISQTEIKRKLISDVQAAAEGFIRHHSLHGVDQLEKRIVIMKETKATSDPHTRIL